MLWLTIGPPGAGKSTWADKHCPPTFLRLERDRFREAIWGDRQRYHTDDTFTRTEKSFVIGSAMFAAHCAWPTRHVCMSDTGLHWDAVKRFIQPNTKLFIFDVALDTLIARNTTRDPAHRVSEEVLLDFDFAFHNEDAWWRKSHFEKEYVQCTS